MPQQKFSIKFWLAQSGLKTDFLQTDFLHWRDVAFADRLLPDASVDLRYMNGKKKRNVISTGGVSVPYMKTRNLVWLRPLLAMLPPVVAFILQWFWNDIQPFVWIFFYPAVFFSAWIGGLLPGLVSTAISALIVWWFFIPPQFSFVLNKPNSLISIGMFVVMGVLFSILLDRMKKAIKQTYEAIAGLSASEEKLSVTLNSIGDAVMATDADGLVTRLNTIAEQLTGWPRSEAISRPVADIFHIINQKTREPAPIPIAATLAEGVIHGLTNDTVLVARDGIEHPIADSCAPIRNRHDEVIGAVLVFRDVTKEYAAKAALRDSATRIKTVLDAVADGIITINQHGIVETLNPAAEHLFGYAADEVIGQNVSMLMPEPHQSRHDSYIERYCTTGEARVIGIGREVEGRRKDGSTFPMYLAISEMDLDGQRHFTGIVHDITERKASEAKLEQLSLRLQLALASAQLGIWDWDVERNVLIWDERMYELYGVAREAFGGAYEAWLAGVHPEDRAYCNEAIQAALRGEKAYDIEFRICWPDGNIHWIKANGKMLKNPEGQVVRAVGINFDITERKQAEELLRQAKENAELANRAKDSFLATMSHEIRTPLTGMLGMLEVLSLTPLNRDQEETLQAAWDSARGLLRIVSDILDWSKIEAGKMYLAPQSTSIPQLLQEVVNTYSRVASAKSLVLKQTVDVRLSPAHIVDGLRLSQVLNNFVSNALKFTHSGEIVVSAKLLEQLESGERIRFAVKDTGIGIAKDAQQQLFRRYQQESVNTTRLYGGTGLGLAICRSLVDLMDGEILLESEPGQGATFSITLTLPVSGTSGEIVQNPHPEVVQRAVNPLFEDAENAPLVLAVDDHPINRDLLARQLRLLGLRTETAENGGDALLKWREGRFALVITDCHMPEMDGYAFTRSVRKIEAEERLSRTPIIAWTANALPEEVEHCHASGMDGLLVKPANLAQLKKTLAKWLSLAGADNSEPIPVLPDADSGQIAGPIDYAVLEQIEPDSAAQIRILHDFQLHIRTDQTRLLELLELGDQANVKSVAHRMKGSSRMVGARMLVDVCATIEQAARDGDMAGARAAKTALDEAISQFDRFLVEVENPNEKLITANGFVNANALDLLVVEDDDFQRRLIVNMLRAMGAKSAGEAGNGRQALELMSGKNQQQFDIVVCDLNMPEMDGLEFLRLLGEKQHRASIVIISALGGKLLTSAGKMVKMYGMKLLGVIEKPVMREQLRFLLAKHDRSENKWSQAADAASFTLEEILQGIRAKQFEPFFQPKVDFQTGRIVGAEALARWIHPQQGVVSPYAFIPLLEQSGNIDELTFLMLEKAAISCRSFHDKGHILTFSVNLSLVTLGDTALSDRITQMVRNVGLDPCYLMLEITESAAMTDVAHSLENLARLSMNGFGLSIDDYGTGYSSMQQLTRIPFSELKIDQSFVKDFADNEALRIVVESSIDMAHKLKVKSCRDTTGLEYAEKHGMRYGAGLLYCQADGSGFVS